ncbi:unnamed protein product [Symbiodinium necroappetens]|uniref:CCHC-type domain-containing protein n=1 Tax=Symbiodinium necroappetens TaxID=1628268 RepID=A0A812SSR2_9DINO|nr:unnamed protein product [Symbiodinium necroappetens]
MAANEVERTKEGVPKWDGSANTFTAYEEACYLYEAGTEMHKRALCGPRLVSELSGAAKRMVSGRSPTWVSNYEGVRVLLEFLRQCLGKPQIPEMTEHLSKYFKHCRRRAQESMNEYITRKAEAYLRAEQALQRVIASQKKKPGTQKPTTSSEEPGSRQDNWSWYPSRRSSVDSSNDAAAEPEEQADEHGETASTRDTWHDWQSQSTSWSWGYGNYDAYNYGGTWGRWSYPYDYGSWWRNKPEATEPKEESGEAWMSRTDLSEEGQAAMEAAEVEAQEALAAITAGKRTLREARFRQHQVKMGRQYFRNGPRGPASSSSSSSTRGNDTSYNKDANMTCLKCGKAGHRAANCKDGPNKALKVDEVHEEQAPFVCFGDHGTVGFASLEEAASAFLGTEAMTTAEAVREGYAILDGGATRTLASVHAIECLMQQNQALHGDARIHDVDVDNTPTFGFGNSSSDRCVSTVSVGLKADGKDGEITIHALNKGEGPILLSVATLRKLGAVLDFENDLVVFRRLNGKKIIKVGRSATGHQTLSLKDDLYTNAQEATQEVPSLREFLPKEEMLRMLAEIGEHVPDNWTKTQIRHRLEGVYQARGLDVDAAFKKQKTPLRSKIVQLNTASRKKAELVKLLQEEFMMEVNPLQTVKQLQAKGLDYIYENTACSPEEKECSIHLRRLAMWLEQEKIQPIQVDMGTIAGGLKEPPPEEPRSSTAATLPPKAKASPKKSGYKTRVEAAASSAASEVSIKTEVLQDLVHSVAALREEVATLKEERPRKKESRSEFSLVSSQGEQDAAWSLVPKTFQALVNQGRPVLMEIGCELSYQAVYQECAGQTGLPEERDQVEEWARQLRLQGAYGFQACEEFLQAFPEGAMKGKREMVVGKSSEYLTFGAFSHGGQYGVTVGCNRFPETIKYLNAFIRSKAQEHDHWSSFTINRNQKLPLHRDVHNHPQELSLICGFGTYTQGELWVEDPDVGEREKVVQNLPDGRRIEGQNLNIHHQFQRFNGKE